MKTRLIVLTDFSSPNLVAVAGSWSKLLEADILLVHKVPGLVPSLSDSESRSVIIEHEITDAKAKLKKLAKEQLPDHPLPIKYLVSESNILNTLQVLLNKEYNDLILVGLKKRNLVQQFFFGSTISKITDELNHTVIAVPETISDFHPDKLIATISYRYPLNTSSFEEFLKILGDSIKEVELISVVTSKDNEDVSKGYLSTLTEKLSPTKPTSYNLFKGENPFKEIKPYINKHDNALLVVQKGSRTLSDQFFRKFLINDLVHDGSIPLVIIPL
jgi:nucleotide-binding universal stress UspA family protein